MGRPIIDLTGQKFNRLKVLKRDELKPHGAGCGAYWICQCDCGNIVSVRTDKLRKNEIKSCGCLSKEIRTKLFLDDLTNKVFGKLTVLKRDDSKPKGKGCFAYWVCKCECGNIVSVRGDHLRNHTTSSCGCLNSLGEEKINNILCLHNINYKTQYTFSDLIGDYNSLRFDFAILNNNNELVGLIEFQGQQHFKKWGNESLDRFNKRLEYDEKKKQYCLSNNIPLMEIKFNDIDKLDYFYLKTRILNEWGFSI